MPTAPVPDPSSTTRLPRRFKSSACFWIKWAKTKAASHTTTASDPLSSCKRFTSTSVGVEEGSGAVLTGGTTTVRDRSNIQRTRRTCRRTRELMMMTANDSSQD